MLLWISLYILIESFKYKVRCSQYFNRWIKWSSGFCSFDWTSNGAQFFYSVITITCSAIYLKFIAKQRFLYWHFVIVIVIDWRKLEGAWTKSVMLVLVLALEPIRSEKLYFIFGRWIFDFNYRLLGTVTIQNHSINSII